MNYRKVAWVKCGNLRWFWHVMIMNDSDLVQRKHESKIKEKISEGDMSKIDE